MIPNGDKPAAPTSPKNSDPAWSAARAGGLTKREHFAAMAMQGLCHATSENGEWAHDATTAAEVAVNYADALLRVLEEK